MAKNDGFEGVETVRLAEDHVGGGVRWLVVLGPSGSRVVELAAGETYRVGRALDCEVCLADDAVSRHHATLHVDDEISIEDVGSANGIFVGGVRIPPRGRVPLAEGISVRVGRALLVAQAGASAPPVDPEPIRATSTSSGPARATIAPPSAHAGIVRDDAMTRLYETAARVAPTRLNVLVLGETGVGKELLATEIHERSGRARGPLVRVNCAALAAQLLESELFGHERGAFTGADRAKKGLIEAADGGTLFLDEVGEMSLDLQAKLLRVVEDRVIKPVGAVAGRAVDVRFVAATNRDLEAEVARGTFRRDLYYRLKGIVLEVPPLRQRRAEIVPLAEHFLAEAVEGRPPELSRGAIDVLLRHDWPGNVRELRQAMEHALALRDGPRIEAAHLPRDVVASAPHAEEPARAAPSVATSASGGLRSDLATLERQRIVDALAACDGNQSKAARMLGMPRRTLVTRIEEYGLPRPRKER